ncbi:MAG: hydroxymethylglutaryl-CoA lyase [Actinomycetota bacterium]|nr:hydroxymethylglutaryl-CoA lyase [Actinomycetota bacterium]
MNVTIRDVVARDGLQGERAVDVERRVELVRRLAGAGLTEIEAAAFVSPKAVPAMAGAAEVVQRVAAELPGVHLWALVPNAKGAELATAAGVERLTITVSASERYSQKNTHMSRDEALAQLPAIRSTAPGAVCDLVISFAFGSAYGNEAITPNDVAAVAARAAGEGIDRVTLADTTGVATPRMVNELLDVTGPDVGLHVHDTRGTALLNAWTAIEHGVRRFDTALGGLGGSPFAPTSGGNLATEDLVALLDDAGIDTGIDLEALIETGPYLRDLVGHDIPSRTAAAMAPEKRSP